MFIYAGQSLNSWTWLWTLCSSLYLRGKSHLISLMAVAGIFGTALLSSLSCASLVMENPEVTMLNEILYFLKRFRCDRLLDNWRCYQAPAEAKRARTSLLSLPNRGFWEDLLKFHYFRRRKCKIRYTNKHPYLRLNWLEGENIHSIETSDYRTLKSQQRYMFRPTAVMESGCLVHNCIKVDAPKVTLLSGNITTRTLDFSLHSVALVI